MSVGSLENGMSVVEKNSVFRLRMIINGIHIIMVVSIEDGTEIMRMLLIGRIMVMK